MGDLRTARMEWMRVLAGFEENPWALALVPMLRLHWFIRLRWVFLVAASGALAFERFVFPEAHRPFALACLVMVLAVVNVIWLMISHLLFRQVRGRSAAMRGQLDRLVIFAHAQVAVDLLLLTGMLHYSGGAENPMAIFYLFHTAIVGQLLKRWHALLQGAWALTLYSLMVVGEWQGWFSHYRFLPTYATGTYVQPEFVVSVIVVVGCGIFGILYFTLHIAGNVQQQERQLQKANAALRQSQRAIEDLQRRRSRFMQTAAHQLKSPLAAIQMMIELIRSRIVPPEAVEGVCKKVINRCQEGIAQVTELLTLARVQEADPLHHRQSQADLRAVMSGLCERFKPLAEGKSIELACNMPEEEGPLHVSVDPRDLGDCIGNLIENAIKYTPERGKVTVTVVPERVNDELVAVLVNVTDTGMGIDPQLAKAPDEEPGREPVFDAFRRGANVIAAGIPGTGLGLSIVREVVEQAGGRIIVSSCPGQGSCFSVTFPSPAGLALYPQVRNTRVSAIVLENTDDSTPGEA